MMTTTTNTKPDSEADVQRLERLRAEHRALKERVAKLEQNLSMTPEEQLECARLKKLKLATKDEIYRLEHGA